MSEFDDALAVTLDGINDGFNQARADLNEIVAQVSEAISRKAGDPNLGLSLQERYHYESEAEYFLAFKSRADGLLGAYHIPTSGYPIGFGIGSGANFSPAGSIADKQQLKEHFQEMLTNRDSPLIVKLAYYLRQKR